jgi:hypothetical protein
MKSIEVSFVVLSAFALSFCFPFTDNNDLYSRLEL